MTKLGPEARALIAAGRHTLRPSAADRERILDALRARIDNAEGPPEGTSSTAAKAGLGRAASTGIFAGAALLGGLLWQLGQPAPEQASMLRPALAISSIVGGHVRPRSPVEPPPPPPAGSSPAAKPAPEVARGSAPRSAPNGLAEEVALLSRAESELHAGRFVKALGLLDDYERRFPKGALTQEDVAARVQALCGLGRVAAAKAQLKRLAPGSPHASRARAACGKERLD